jgi:hypothetical protein
MPRLSYPRLTEGDAIYALLKLYRNDPDFMKELNELRSPYMALVDRFSIDALSFAMSAPPLSAKEWLQAGLDYDPSKGKTGPLPTEEQFPYFAQLQPYFDSLGELAYKWKLRARWAVLTLFFLDIVDCWKAKGMPNEIELPPLEAFDSLFPWELPASPLTITVPAWTIVVLGREKVLDNIATRLRQYENEIKTSGLKEYPSALEDHARWWFEHYVHGKKYTLLAKEFPSPKGVHSDVNRAESIRKAVWKFSKLTGVKVP